MPSIGNSCDQTQNGYQSRTSAGAFNGRSIVAGNSSITITNGDGISGNTSIVANITDGSLSWSIVTGATQAASVGNGYIANNAGTLVITLPAVSAVGDQIGVMGINNSTGWKIAQNSGNQIFLGILASTLTTGYLASTSTYDSVILMCVTANANWVAFAPQGNITVA
jgi:hypothetical protein